MTPVHLATIGHSTLPLDTFIDILRVHGIKLLVDVRRYPGSRRYPHFNKEILERALGEAGIDYVHIPGLGGRRTPRAGSHNTGLRNAMFRGYADHMETDEFKAAAGDLLQAAAGRPTAIMCAEGNRFKCHRSLIADYLAAKGHVVTHIQGKGDPAPHAFTSAAVVQGGEVRYPGYFRILNS